MARLRVGYHYTTSRNYVAIRRWGLYPSILNKPNLRPYDRGIWLWPRRLRGDAHLGSVLWQLWSKGETRVVLLRCRYDPTTVVGYPENWTVKHSGGLGVWDFHTRVPCVVVTEPIPAEKIELVDEYDLRRMLR